MRQDNFLFTSESVTEGHPDKLADQVSDAVLDAILAKDAEARVACETLVKTGLCLVAGEVTTDCYVEIPEIVRQVIKRVGYESSEMGFDGMTCALLTAIGKQSGDIAQGVNQGEGLHEEQGAGDQGMMFGYACTQTDALMPAPIYYSHKLTERLTKVRKDNALNFLRPDGKSQVTVEFENGEIKSIPTVVISTQHTPEVSYEQIKEGVIEEVIKPELPSRLISDARFLINPTGRFEIGGPHGDCGLTGRKIIVDTYGGWSRHGGGAFSGKDPSKVDRSAAYMARYIAKNIVAAGVAKECEVQFAYAIGVAEPVSVMVETFGTSTVDETKIAKAVRETFAMKPQDIIDTFQLKRPIYLQTAAYGHFGRDPEHFPWERTDKVEALRSALS